MPITLRELKKEKLSEVYFLTKGYDSPEDCQNKINGSDIVIKFDVVGCVRLYQGDEIITEDLKEFFNVNKEYCYRTMKEAEDAKERRTK